MLIIDVCISLGAADTERGAAAGLARHGGGKWREKDGGAGAGGLIGMGMLHVRQVTRAEELSKI